MKETDEKKLDVLAREWAAKIEFLMASADKVNKEQKIRYFEYIDSLRARQRNLQEIFQELRSSNDFDNAAGRGSDTSGDI